jgi:hypothetical protein
MIPIVRDSESPIYIPLESQTWIIVTKRCCMKVCLSCIACLHGKAVQLHPHTFRLLTVMWAAERLALQRNLQSGNHLRLLQNGCMRKNLYPLEKLLAAFASESFSKRMMLSRANLLLALTLFATKVHNDKQSKPFKLLGDRNPHSYSSITLVYQSDASLYSQGS